MATRNYEELREKMQAAAWEQSAANVKQASAPALGEISRYCNELIEVHQDLERAISELVNALHPVLRPIIPPEPCDRKDKDFAGARTELVTGATTELGESLLGRVIETRRMLQAMRSGILERLEL